MTVELQYLSSDLRHKYVIQIKPGMAFGGRGYLVVINYLVENFSETYLCARISRSSFSPSEASMALLI